MSDENLHSEKPQASTSLMSKDERYELIARIARGLNKRDGTQDALDFDPRQIWDTNNTEINFSEFVSHQN